MTCVMETCEAGKSVTKNETGNGKKTNITETTRHCKCVKCRVYFCNVSRSQGVETSVELFWLSSVPKHYHSVLTAFHTQSPSFVSMVFLYLVYPPRYLRNRHSSAWFGHTRTVVSLGFSSQFGQCNNIYNTIPLCSCSWDSLSILKTPRSDCDCTGT